MDFDFEQVNNTEELLLKCYKKTSVRKVLYKTKKRVCVVLLVSLGLPAVLMIFGLLLGSDRVRQFFPLICLAMLPIMFIFIRLYQRHLLHKEGFAIVGKGSEQSECQNSQCSILYPVKKVYHFLNTLEYEVTETIEKAQLKAFYNGLTDEKLVTKLLAQPITDLKIFCEAQGDYYRFNWFYIIAIFGFLSAPIWDSYLNQLLPKLGDKFASMIWISIVLLLLALTVLLYGIRNFLDFIINWKSFRYKRMAKTLASLEEHIKMKNHADFMTMPQVINKNSIMEYEELLNAHAKLLWKYEALLATNRKLQVKNNTLKHMKCLHRVKQRTLCPKRRTQSWNHKN